MIRRLPYQDGSSRKCETLSCTTLIRLAKAHEKIGEKKVEDIGKKLTSSTANQLPPSAPGAPNMSMTEEQQRLPLLRVP